MWRTRPDRHAQNMRTLRIVLSVAAALMAVPVLAAPARAAAVSSTPPTRAALADCGGAPTAEALADFFDQSIPDALVKNKVPGTVVSVVSGDQIAFSKGYGLSNVEDKVPFDSDRSLVRIASISKLFTFSAVMQQVQAGRLDLNADVNRYLTAFKIPATYPQPITVRDLMDHTTGFEDRIIGTGARTAGDVIPLEQELARTMPARIRPPGQISAYSNYGAALAGYLVSKVSGQPYDQYVEQNLFGPLAMTHSTATEPVPASLATNQARSYNSDETPMRRVPFEFDQWAPDGSISATANDMAHFMIAHLNDGKYGDASILSPATTAQMHQVSFAADARLAGYAHGFMARNLNGHQVLEHDGSWEAFESVLITIPGCHLGLFMSANSTGGVDALTPVIPAFLRRFAPAPSTPDPVPTPAATAPFTPSEPTAGFYEPTRHNETGLEKVLNLLGPSRMVIDPDGTLHFRNKVWTTGGDGLYQPADGSDHLVFLRGPDGQRYVATDGPDLQLMPTVETLPFNLYVVGAGAVIAISALIVLLIGLIRRLVRRPGPATGRWRLARALAGGAAILSVLFLVTLFTVLATRASGFLFSVPVGFRLLLGLPFVALVMAAAGLVLTVRGWRGPGVGWVARVHQVLVFAAVLALTWFSWQWNLVGWQY